ncbi:hypothetical protein ABZZ79_23165 [Streptomyces sp. NPDC006458]|uniref:hypothetical protein n=1 Tax=Streptomyces sp. NPDC006458 TaxID=3154302 RepID=UPI0033A99A18
MSITPPSVPVLRGRRNTSLQFDGSALILRRGAKELEIPLAAVARVRSAQRVVEVQLTAARGKPPTHRVEQVSEAAGDAFAQAVNAALPGVAEPAADGASLVIARGLDDEGRKLRKRRRIRLGLLALTVLLIAQTVVVSLADEPELSFLVWMGGFITGTFGAFAVHWSPFDTPAWRLPRHGVSVMARYQGYIDGMHIYDFTDLNGKQFAYTPNGYRGEQVEIVYDPSDPFNGTERDLLLGRRTLLLPMIFCAVPALLMFALCLAMVIAIPLS